MQTTVLLADDHAIVRDTLAALMEGSPDLHVVGQAHDGRDAIEAAQRLRPDTVVMDISMPELDGVEATRQILEECPDTQVLILSMHQTTEIIRRAFKAGARGYVLKESAGTEVVDAIRTVREGGRYLSPRIAENVLEDYLCSGRQPSVLDTLSLLERDVLRLLIDGRCEAMIAEELSLSPAVVDTLIEHTLQKFGAEDRVQLVQIAIRYGMIV